MIAHPEGSAYAILYGAEGVRHEVERGAVGQAGAQSITGAHGAAASETAFELISDGLLRTSAPTRTPRPGRPLLREARARLIEGGVAAVARNSLIGGCPRRLLGRRVPSGALRVV